MRRLLFPILFALSLLALTGLASQPIVAELSSISPLPPVQNPDGRAGTCFSYYPNEPPDPHPYLPLVLDAGSRWDRFTFDWRNIEPENDQWAFSAYDALVDDLGDAGMNIVGILLWTPDWAATGGTTGLSLSRSDGRPPGWYVPVPHSAATGRTATAASSSPPQGLYLPWYDPNNHWGNFVYTVVSHYKDRGVTHWEMWNEPEWDYFWTGTFADYAQLLKVGYQATKAACRDCTVLFGGLHYWANPDFYKWVLNVLNDDPDAPENNYFFDVMSVHLYSRSSNVYDVVNDIRAGMLEFVPDHPIWLTETGVPVWGDPYGWVPDIPKYDYAATPDEAAAYVLQSYAEGWASGIEKYFFFRTNDDWCDKNQDGDCDDKGVDGGMSELFGLIRDDRSLRPAYVALQVATTYLVSPTMTTRWTYADGVRRVTLWGTPWGKISVLWNTTPVTLDFGYPAVLPTATLVDRWGVTQTIIAAGGVYTLTLPGATANLGDTSDYIIGGDPYLVIEADTTAPTTTTVQPLPPTTYSHTVLISATATDEGAGVWGYELQVQEEGGSWSAWPGIHPSPIRFTGGEHGKQYCFRARAWDLAGNVGGWSDGVQCTTIDLTRQVYLETGPIFGDGDEDGVQDAGEVTVTAHLRLVDAMGMDVVTPTVGTSWTLTVTLMAGGYTLTVTPESWPSPPPGWLPGRRMIAVEAGEGVQEVRLGGVGLLPHVASVYMPVVRKE